MVLYPQIIAIHYDAQVAVVGIVILLEPQLLGFDLAFRRLKIINPAQAVTVPARIRVLPKLNSLTGIPKPTARRPASKQPIPATNIPVIIKTTPRLRSATRTGPVATIPSY